MKTVCGPILTICLAVSGCGDIEPPPVMDMPGPAEMQPANLEDELDGAEESLEQNAADAMQNAQQESRRAINAIGDATDLKRQQLTAYVERRKADVEERIQRMKASADDMQADAKAQYQQRAAELSVNRQRLEDKLQRAKNASADNLQKAQQELNAAWADFRNAFNETAEVVDEVQTIPNHEDLDPTAL